MTSEISRLRAENQRLKDTLKQVAMRFRALGLTTEAHACEVVYAGAYAGSET